MKSRNLNDLNKQIQNPDYLDIGWVRGHLGLLTTIDQDYRRDMISASKNNQEGLTYKEWQATIQDALSFSCQSIDEVSLTQLKKILDAHGGWKSFLRIADMSIIEHAALIVQHANHDCPFQISTLREWKKSGVIDTNMMGYLCDRIQVIHYKKPQVYGTQGALVNGIWQPYACKLKTAEEVDKLRLTENFTLLNGATPLTLSEYFRIINGFSAGEEHPSIEFLPIPP